MQAQEKPCDFQSGCFYDRDANAVICANLSTFSGAHSDIRHPGGALGGRPPLRG